MRLTQAGYEALAEMFGITQNLRRHLLHGIPGSEIAGADRFLELLIDRIESGMCEPNDG
jgi:hypothetical protein